MGQTTLPPQYSSTFTSNNLPAGWSLVESTYVTACGASCTPFTTGNLLSTTVFTSTGTVTQLASNPLPSGSTYETTEVYTIYSNGTTGSAQNADIDLSAAGVTPLPSTWTMFIATLLGMGWFAWRGPNKRMLGIAGIGTATTASRIA